MPEDKRMRTLQGSPMPDKKVRFIDEITLPELDHLYELSSLLRKLERLLRSRGVNHSKIGVQSTPSTLGQNSQDHCKNH